MIDQPARPATNEGLFVWVLHRFAEVFEEHAIVKGGIALRLLDCPRSTTDIDYVFVPYESKKDIAAEVEAVLREMEGATVDVQLHSKMLRADVALDDARIQVEANVDIDCPSVPVATGSFATAQGKPSRIVRAMDLERALANKLAAWNERRLLRDLFDVYYLGARLGATPDTEALVARLGRIESRLPALRGKTSMGLGELCAAIRKELDQVDEARLRDELGAVLPATELASLLPRLRAGVTRVVETLETQ